MAGFDICRECSTKSPFYAKQTQFQKCSNLHMPFFTQDLWKYSPFLATQKRTQNEPKRSQFQKMQKWTFMLSCKGLMMIFTLSAAKKTKPKQTQFLQKVKMNINSFITKDYENVPPWRPKKTNPNKPNQTQSACNGDRVQHCKSWGLNDLLDLNFVPWQSMAQRFQYKQVTKDEQQ